MLISDPGSKIFFLFLFQNIAVALVPTHADDKLPCLLQEGNVRVNSSLTRRCSAIPPEKLYFSNSFHVASDALSLHLLHSVAFKAPIAPQLTTSLAIYIDCVCGAAAQSVAYHFWFEHPIPFITTYLKVYQFRSLTYAGCVSANYLNMGAKL